MEKTDPKSIIDQSKDEIDLIELIKHIWLERKIIYKTTIICIGLGLIISIFLINEYKSEAKLLPEISKKEGGVSSLMKQFGGLSSLAGIDLNSLNTSDALNPKIYPDIINSTPFMIQLLNSPIKIPSHDSTVSLYTYMNNIQKKSVFDFLFKYTLGLPGTIKDLFSKDLSENVDVSVNDSPIRISLKMSKTIEELAERVQSDVNIENGIISISAEFRDPEVASQIAEKSVLYLKEYITEYSLQKVRDNLKFVSEQCEIAKIEFSKAQLDRALFLDANRNIISARIESEKQRLQSQYDLTYNIYNGLAQQKEQAKIKVQEETPVFKVLNPVQVPNEKSRPKRSLILFGMIFLGIAVGIGTIVFRKIFFSQVESTPINDIST